jgi:hypothetical protein
MYASGYHYRVKSVEEGFITCDSSVAATYSRLCILRPHDCNPVIAKLEYIGHIEEILQLDYGRFSVVVLICDFMKVNYVGKQRSIKKNKWAFTLANFNSKVHIWFRVFCTSATLPARILLQVSR